MLAVLTIIVVNVFFHHDKLTQKPDEEIDTYSIKPINPAAQAGKR